VVELILAKGGNVNVSIIGRARLFAAKGGGKETVKLPAGKVANAQAKAADGKHHWKQHLIKIFKHSSGT